MGIIGRIIDFFEDIFDDSVPSIPKKPVENIEIKFIYTDATYSGEATDAYGGIKPHGTGVARLKNGDRFSGEFSYGKPRKGKYTFANGSYCQVEYNDNIAKYSAPYGYRKSTQNEKYSEYEKEYVGELLNGVPHGIGKMTYTRRYFLGLIKYYENYEGGFLNGKRHGVGKYVFENGDYDISVYLDDIEVKRLERFEKEYENTNIEEEEDDDEITSESDGYNGWGNKESAINWIEHCIRDGRYEEARRELENFDSDTDLRIYIDGNFVDTTAGRLKEDVKDWANQDEDENDY